MRQTGFKFLKDYKKEFGGNLLAGKRKTARPLSISYLELEPYSFDDFNSHSSGVLGFYSNCDCNDGKLFITG